MRHAATAEQEQEQEHATISKRMKIFLMNNDNDITYTQQHNL
jgi:hypothetical protein